MHTKSVPMTARLIAGALSGFMSYLLLLTGIKMFGPSHTLDIKITLGFVFLTTLFGCWLPSYIFGLLNNAAPMQSLKINKDEEEVQGAFMLIVVLACIVSFLWYSSTAS